MSVEFHRPWVEIEAGDHRHQETIDPFFVVVRDGERTAYMFPGPSGAGDQRLVDEILQAPDSPSDEEVWKDLPPHALQAMRWGWSQGGDECQP